MANEPDSEQQIKAEFTHRRSRQLILAVPLIVLFFFSELSPDKGTTLGLSGFSWSLIFLAAVIAGLIFTYSNWRCPACNKHLGTAINPSTCRKCDAELR
ncbi:MAG: hypothetical protein GKR89_34230 [Candidatus Latescibacteria bacterium]|nr:hypothetical protein [Candidatus Latescibacterota bacterium]